MYKNKSLVIIHNEWTESDEEAMSREAQRALRAFTTNLNDEVKKERVDPVIGLKN